MNFDDYDDWVFEEEDYKRRRRREMQFECNYSPKKAKLIQIKVAMYVLNGKVHLKIDL